MERTLRTFQQKEFLDHTLSFVKQSFLESYLSIIATKKNSPFVKFYPLNEPRIEKSFFQFDQDVRRVAFHLENDSVTFSTIALQSENSYELMVYIVAVLMKGLTLCLLSPSDSPSLVESKLQQLGENTKLYKQLSIPELESPPIWTEIPMSQKERKVFINVFTSGSTGTSKIVEQLETGVLSNIEGLARHHQLSLTTPVTIATPLPLFHVNALEFSFLTSLLTGQKLVCYETFDFFQSLKSLKEDQVQIYSAVPHIFHIFSQNIKRLTNTPLPTFKYFVSAAAPLPLITQKNMALNGFRVLQGYGLSEAVNFSLMTPTDLSPLELIEIAEKCGRPTAGTALWGNDVFILKEDLTPAQENEIGNVAIRGLNVMSGYRNSSHSEVFSSDYLFTGDQGFYIQQRDPERRLYFISGRTKDIVKKWGKTTSLVETDELLLRLLKPETDGISVGFEHLQNGEDIALMISGHSNEELKVLASSILSSWPDHLRPSFLISTNRKLRTASGKPLRWTFKDLCQKISSQNTNPHEIQILEEEHLRDGTVSN